MEKWFVESKALSVSCNYELVVWAAVWLNQSKQYEDIEDEQDQQQQQQQEEQGAQGGVEAAAAGAAAGVVVDPGLDFTRSRSMNLLQSPLGTPSPVVPHTYTTPWHEFLCAHLASAATSSSGQTELPDSSDQHNNNNTAAAITAMDIDSDVDEGVSDRKGSAGSGVGEVGRRDWAKGVGRRGKRPAGRGCKIGRKY